MIKFYSIILLIISLPLCSNAASNSREDVDLPTVGSIIQPSSVKYSDDNDKTKPATTNNSPTKKLSLPLNFFVNTNYHIPSPATPNFTIPSIPPIKFATIPKTIFTPEEEKELASLEEIILKIFAMNTSIYIEQVPEPANIIDNKAKVTDNTVKPNKIVETPNAKSDKPSVVMDTY